MGASNDGILTSNNSCNSSMSSISTVATKTTIVGDDIAGPVNEPLESITDEQIIQKNLKELMDKKHQEERKANGRLVAVILSTLIIFLAIYHAWIRNSGILAGILVPAVIMLSFGAWVMILAKRDKARRQVFEKYLQEVALKNKQELLAKSKSKSRKSKDKKSSSNILLHYENEINREQIPLLHLSNNSSSGERTTSVLKNKNHRKQRKQRIPANSGSQNSPTSSSSKKSSHYATKDLRVKRPSIRQNLFQQAGNYRIAAMNPNVTHTLAQSIINTQVHQGTPPLVNGIPIVCPISPTLLETKRKRLQRLKSLQMPTMMRMSSAP